MKARAVKLVYGVGYIPCAVEEATHVKIRIPGPTGHLHLPMITSGTRAGTDCWSWNGSEDSPTLRPSILSTSRDEDGPFRCHTWVTDGKAIFLDDCTHEYKGKTLDLLEVD